MNSTLKVSSIVIFGVLISITLPHFITLTASKNLEAKKQVETVNTRVDTPAQNDNAIAVAPKKDTAVPVVEQEVEKPNNQIEEEVETPKEEPVTAEVKETTTEVKPEPTINIKSYGEMTSEELINAIASGAYKLEYSKIYDTNANKLSKSKGAIYYDNHKETYYSEKVLPGTSLKIPGRHVADDGTIRDGDGYIAVAANTSYRSKGTVVKTSLGPGKVYDSGCASGIIDIYTSW